MSKLGYPVDGDLNDGVAVGASIIPADLSAWNQSRFDTRTAQYDPVKARTNLHLLTGHTVTRVLHSKATGTTVNPPAADSETPDLGLWVYGVEVSSSFAAS